jgi:hypothetical protein
MVEYVGPLGDNWLFLSLRQLALIVPTSKSPFFVNSSAKFCLSLADLTLAMVKCGLNP